MCCPIEFLPYGKFFFALQKFTGNHCATLLPVDFGNIALNFENLAVCLVKDIGPVSALALLEKEGIPEGQLSFEFYQNCVVATSLESQQR